MTRKEQNKMLDDKIESNVNQYKVDRFNTEISAFSSGDLNKYEFLTRKDLKYKPNALDKARFEFSPLGQTFSTGLDKTAQGYQEEGVIKLLKDNRDGLASGNRPNNDDGDDGDDKKNKEEKYADMPDLETEEDAAKRIADSYEQKKDNYDDITKKLKDRILYLDTKLKDSKLSNEEKDKLNKELIEPNDKLEDFIEVYNDIVKEEEDKIRRKLNKFDNDMEDNIYKLEKANEYLDKFDNKISTIGETAPILIYANTTNNRIVSKIKTGYKLELLSKERMKLLGSTKDIIDSDKNSENVPRIENVEVVLVHCNLVNNSYRQASRVLFTFVPNKQYGQLISISPNSLTFLKTMNNEFSEIEIWFTDQNNNSLEIEDNVNISLIINTS